MLAVGEDEYVLGITEVNPELESVLPISPKPSHLEPYKWSEMKNCSNYLISIFRLKIMVTICTSDIRRQTSVS